MILAFFFSQAYKWFYGLIVLNIIFLLTRSFVVIVASFPAFLPAAASCCFVWPPTLLWPVFFELLLLPPDVAAAAAAAACWIWAGLKILPGKLPRPPDWKYVSQNICVSSFQMFRPKKKITTVYGRSGSSLVRQELRKLTHWVRFLNGMLLHSCHC